MARVEPHSPDAGLAAACQASYRPSLPLRVHVEDTTMV